jgi:hypothetical protein
MRQEIGAGKQARRKGKAHGESLRGLAKLIGMLRTSGKKTNFQPARLVTLFAVLIWLRR